MHYFILTPKCGADPDIGDDFSNVNLKAREKGLHWWSGKFLFC